MHIRLPKRPVATWLALCVAVILVVMPFHATVTVWLSSFVGHYTALRLWKEWLLLALGGGALYLAVKDTQLRRRVGKSLLTRLVMAYVAVEIIWGVVAYLIGAVTLPALAYGWISDTRYVIFFVVVWVIANKVPWLKVRWARLVFWPAAAVIGFGLMQYFVLPYDFMVHLGYRSETIFPYETINHNIDYIRIMSTLRGANPLGAYLLVILSLAVALLVSRQRRAWLLENKRRLVGTALFCTAGLLALVLTFSRSAWIGLGVSLACIAWVWLGNRRARVSALAAAGLCLVMIIGAGVGLRDNTTFQNVFLHTQEHSLAPVSSNEGHITALQQGLADLARYPLGQGPGTAGPASVYNTGHPARIAENYFIQIAQETGLVGLGLFIAVNIVLARALWLRRSDALSLGLLASLIGITVVGFLSHVWADDTLAYIWWGLAAVALAARPASAGKD